MNIGHPERRWYKSDLFWLLNGLNLVDAALTMVVLRAGIALEANPFVRLIGLPGKLILVAVASAILVRLRPVALLIPIAGMLAAVGWTLTGLALYS
jgi:hypothetical protein